MANPTDTAEQNTASNPGEASRSGDDRHVESMARSYAPDAQEKQSAGVPATREELIAQYSEMIGEPQEQGVCTPDNPSGTAPGSEPSISQAPETTHPAPMTAEQFAQKVEMIHAAPLAIAGMVVIGTAIPAAVSTTLLVLERTGDVIGEIFSPPSDNRERQ